MESIVGSSSGATSNSTTCPHLLLHATEGTSIEGVTKAILILFLSVAALIANLVVLAALASRRYGRVVQPQPRYLMISLACTDLLTALLVLPPAVYPALFSCWPYGDIVCQSQALLHGALSHQASLLLVWMAIDRYLFLIYPRQYRKLADTKCIAISVFASGLAVLGLFAALSLWSGRRSATISPKGWPGCVPSFPNRRWRIASVCALYFPPTLATMYCYGTAFHRRSESDIAAAAAKAMHNGGLNRCKKTPDVAANDIACPSHNNHGGNIIGNRAKIWRLTSGPSRTMAALSLAFIVVVTPWTTHEVVVACTEAETPLSMQFAVTWMARSSGLWNALLYWLMDSHFRTCAAQLFRGKVLDDIPSSRSSTGRPGTSLNDDEASTDGSRNNSEVDSPGERQWGEILERAVSSSSLQALQRIYGHGLGPPMGPAARLWRWDTASDIPLPTVTRPASAAASFPDNRTKWEYV